MPPEPIVSIIIPTLREEQFLERTLKNLEALQLPHEIIITDGGSQDRTLDIARAYDATVTVWGESRRQTFGEAKNAGAALASGTFLVFIDADVLIPEPQAFFIEILKAFDTNKKLIAMTVPLKPFPENHSWIDALLCMPLNWFYIITNNVFHSGNSSGEFQMIRADAFREEKGFKEHLAAGEDNEIFRELANHGRTLSYRKLCVRHSLRRIRKLGWLRVYYSWIKNGFSVMFRNKAAYTEWAIIR